MEEQEHNPRILKGGAENPLTLTSSYLPAYRIPRNTPASVARTVLVGLFRGLHYLLFLVILWLRVPLLWAFEVIARLAIVGAVASGLFWWVSPKPEAVVVQTALVCIAASFVCHLLLWGYNGLLLWLSPNRL